MVRVCMKDRWPAHYPYSQKYSFARWKHSIAYFHKDCYTSIRFMGKKGALGQSLLLSFASYLAKWGTWTSFTPSFPFLGFLSPSPVLNIPFCSPEVAVYKFSLLLYAPLHCSSVSSHLPNTPRISWASSMMRLWSKKNLTFSTVALLLAHIYRAESPGSVDLISRVQDEFLEHSAENWLSNPSILSIIFSFCK